VLKKLTIFIFLFLSIKSFSQLTGEINFNAGLGLPLGDLPKEEWLNPESGFAETGYNFGVDVSGFYKDTFGVGFGFSNFYYPVDEDPMVEQAFEPGVDSVVEINSDDWRISYNMLLLKYRYHFNPRFALGIIAKVGWMRNRAPQITVKALDVSGKNIVLQRDAESATALATGLGLQLNYLFKDNYGFNLSTNFTMADARYEYKGGDVIVNRMLYSYGVNAGVFFLF
jgi:hypothetical protein